MIVWLYKVGRNLNRAYRTCEAFGVTDLRLIACDALELAGNLYRAKDRVNVARAADWPPWETALALETGYPRPLSSVDWGRVDHLLIGGETVSLPRSKIRAAQVAHIPQPGQVSGLTVEAALAIALYDWRERGLC